jgi:YD repeat-containing protein
MRSTPIARALFAVLNNLFLSAAELFGICSAALRPLSCSASLRSKTLCFSLLLLLALIVPATVLGALPKSKGKDAKPAVAKPTGNPAKISSGNNNKNPKTPQSFWSALKKYKSPAPTPNFEGNSSSPGIDLPLEVANGYEPFSYGLLDRDNLRESLERVASFADECPVGYKSLGGNIMSDASAVPFKKKLFVFVRGIDSKLYYRVFQKAKRGEWLSLDGNIISNPATYFTTDAVFVEVTGADGQRYHRSTADGETFTEWKQGSVKALTTTPSVTVRGTTVTFKRGNGSNPSLCVNRVRRKKRNNNNQNNNNGNNGNNTQGIADQKTGSSDSLSDSQLVSINQTDGNERGDRNRSRRGGPSASVLDEIGEFGTAADDAGSGEAELSAPVAARPEDPCEPWGWFPGCDDDPPPPQGDQYSPNGVLDSIDVSAANNVNGWSYDPDSPSLSNDVHIYFDGPAGSGTGYGTTANWARPDLNAYFGISGDHGFNFQIPAQYADGQQHVVYTYGIDTGFNNPSHLNGSPKYFTKNPPPPDAPSWGAIYSISQTQLDVYWNAVPNASAYNVKMDGNVVYSNIPYVSAPFTNLAPGSTHTFEVQAINQWGVSNWSSPLLGTTQPPLMPATPTWGTVNVISQTQLDIYWNQAANSTSYNVRMNGTQIVTNFNGLSKAVTGLAPSTTYTFEVQGVNQYGVSAWSDSRSGTTLPAPTPTPPPTPTPTPNPTPTPLPGGNGGGTTARARLSPKNATGGTNLYSRNFGWGTGLAGLSGRGLDAGFGISYNSLVWVKNGTDIVFNPNNDNVTPGFRFGYPVIEPSYTDSLTNKSTFLMVSPSGARTEFRLVDGTSDTFETADSSYLQIKVVDANTLVLYGTDGSRMTYTLKNGIFRTAQIKDANGNFVTINHDNNGLLQSVTDTLGRVFNVTYDGGGQPYQITQAWANGTHVYATFAYTTQTISTNFSGLNQVGVANGANIKVLQKIIFADASETRFEYNSYGQVWRISNYAADTHKLSHSANNLDWVAGQAQTDCPRFTQLRSWAENYNVSGGAPQEIVIPVLTGENHPANLPNGTSVNATMVAVTAPDGVITNTYYGNSGWAEGLPLLVEDYTVENGGFSKKRWNWTSYTQDNTALGYILNPRMIESRIGDNANVKRTTVEYHTQAGNPASTYYGLVKDVIQYNANGTSQLKRSHTEYDFGPEYISRRIIGLPVESTLYDENNALLSRVTYGYDNEDGFTGTNQNISPVQHDTASYGTGFPYRGNVTSVTRWDVTNATNGALAVTSQVRHNTAGSPVAQIDPLGRTVKISYADFFDDGQNRSSFAYPTTVTDPANFSSTVKYRFDIGVNVEAESPAPAGNPVGKKTARIYDALGRLERETIVNTGAYTRYEYPANGIQSRVFSTVTDTNGNGADGADEVLTETFTDGAGRTRAARSELPNSAGGWSASLTEYDVMGRVRMQSVPTEVDGNWQPAGDDAARGYLWTTNEYDWKGRTTRVINTDGTDKLMSYEGCGCAGGQVTTVSGEQLAEGRRRQKVYEDILGRSYKSETLNWDGSVYSSTRTTFNGLDQATLVRQFAGADTSQTYQDTVMTYDGHG